MVQYYAKIKDNVVVDINVVADALVEESGEQAGSDLLTDLFGGQWVRFSKTGEFRFNRPSSGSIYDADADAFYAPQPFASWTLDEQFQWQPPTPKPEGDYIWNEEAHSWDEVVV